MEPQKGIRLAIPHTAEGCKTVTHVNLVGAKHINKKVQALVDGPALDNLETLDISQGKDLQNRYAIKCLKKFPTITKLNLTGCRKIEDKTLEQIGKLLPNLTHLKLSVCPLITDRGLEALVTGCKKLEYLNLSLDFHTCEERYKVRNFSEVSSSLGIRKEDLVKLTPVVIETFLPKVWARIQEKTSTQLTLNGLQNIVNKCEALKTLYVPCILESKEDLLTMILEEGNTLGKTAAKVLEELPDEGASKELRILSYEQDPSVVWASTQEWTVDESATSENK
ncbi:MAG: hypothetical protein JSR46_09270 [Verrucomicrobia bacterium]|nr:hypothetical protein [Verrucomicrobiota bacterium]